MRVVEFETPLSEIELLPIADVHIGSPQWDEPLFKQTCEYVEKKDNCFVLLNGDILDNNIRNSIGAGVFEQTMSPLDQVTTAAYYLSKIAAQKKIVNITVGNHEARSEKDTGLSPMDLLLAKLMNYDDTLNKRYCVDGAYTFLTMKARKGSASKVTTTIFNLHGSGNGSKIGAKISRLQDMQSIIAANIYVRSHTHQPETHRGTTLTVNTTNHLIREESCIFVNTGSYLRYGGYSARAGMQPLSRGIPIITIKLKRAVTGEHDKMYKQIECVIKERLDYE